MNGWFMWPLRSTEWQQQVEAAAVQAGLVCDPGMDVGYAACALLAAHLPALSSSGGSVTGSEGGAEAGQPGQGVPNEEDLQWCAEVMQAARVREAASQESWEAQFEVVQKMVDSLAAFLNDGLQRAAPKSED